MLAKRIIPCLDIKNGRTVKGVNFENIRDAGDPVELAVFYSQQGADELVFLDITATIEKRKTLYSLVSDLACHMNIPFTVGGGINDLYDISQLLQNGADKISINTAAFLNPDLIKNAAKEFGSQCIVLAIDAKIDANGESYVYLNGGRTKTEATVAEWARRGVESGAGEILLTSMDHDGTKNGFAIQLTRELSRSVSVPVIASGGAGSIEDFYAVFTQTEASAALAASIFHFKEIEIPVLKHYLSEKQIPIRI